MDPSAVPMEEEVAWEGVANAVLAEVGAEHEAVDPRAIAAAFGMELVPVLESSGRGACVVGDVIRFPALARPVRQAGVIGHELGHMGLAWCGEPQSERGAAYIGAAIVVPRLVLDRSLRRVGWELDPLREAFPHASAELLARRIADVRDAVVTVLDRGRVKARLASHWLAQPSKSLTRREREAIADPETRRDGLHVWRLEQRTILVADADQLGLRF